MDNKRVPRKWGDLPITSLTAVEKEAISNMARLVNEITNRRKQLGLTQQQVSERAGITQAQVARLENSHSVPSMETVMKVAIALGLKIGFEEAAAAQTNLSYV
ncbi:helix-turn-helix domain-containing protein [Paenibacillus sp. YYML68]|uniref:helix-turn-helix domain-containing protein n=1 Tax=Paenibacillus sp. YYML68 TaxID=2909250 RepID=UPI002492D37D|nr:helix-turn-helix transcriptional regulator [Paenibacillus sp. YYML68]